MNKFKRLWKGTLPLFLVLWAVMICILGAVNAKTQDVIVKNAMQSAWQRKQEDYREIWAGEGSEGKKPVILMGRLGSELYNYDGVAQFRFYTADGQELTRSQMAKGIACLPGTGVYSWYILLDPVLTQEEQLALAKMLREDSDLNRFYGTVGGLVPESETDERYCEVVGVVDQEREIIYPQKLIYVYADREVTLVDISSNFFEGKILTTLCFDSVSISSALVGRNASPEEMLRRWQEAEEKMETLLDGRTPSLNFAASSSNGSQCAPLGMMPS